MSNQADLQPDSKPVPEPKSPYYNFRIRRYSFAEWCGWLIWLIALVILVEYAFTSIAEHELQAGILAGVIASGVLFARIIVEVMKSIDLRSRHDEFSPPVDKDTSDG